MTQEHLDDLFKLYEDKLSQLDDITKYNEHNIDYMWSGFRNRFFHIRFDDRYYWQNVKCICKNRKSKVEEYTIKKFNGKELDDDDAEDICPCEDTTCSDAIMDFHVYCPEMLLYDRKVLPNDEPQIMISWGVEDKETTACHWKQEGRYDTDVIFMSQENYDEYAKTHPYVKKEYPQSVSQYRYIMKEYIDKLYGLNEIHHTLSLKSIPILERNLKRLDRELLRQETFKKCMEEIRKNQFS